MRDSELPAEGTITLLTPTPDGNMGWGMWGMHPIAKELLHFTCVKYKSKIFYCGLLFSIILNQIILVGNIFP